jgi:short-subunit dehydrogenase
MAKYDLHNKKVFISGVSGGIGRELALKLIRDYNCHVFGVARNQQKLKDLENECGGRLIAEVMDVSQSGQWQGIARKLREADFYPDVIINNAGVIHPFDSILNLSDQEIDSVINTNYKSIIYCVRNLTCLLEKSQSPAIINILSAAAALPVLGTSIYSSSKRAALSLTESLWQEFSPKGIYVAAVLSGPVKTGLYQSRSGEDRQKIKESIISKVGVSAATEAARIIRGISKRKKRIVSGIIAKTMSAAYKAAPQTSVTVSGFFTRLLPLKTFKAIFKKRDKK